MDYLQTLTERIIFTNFFIFFNFYPQYIRDNVKRSFDEAIHLEQEYPGNFFPNLPDRSSLAWGHVMTR